MKIARSMKALSLSMVAVSLILTGCGDSAINEAKTYQKTVNEALGEDELEKRQEGGEELLYRRDDQTPYTGWFVARWEDPDSSIRILAQYKDGRKDGPYVQYDENLAEQLKGHYKNGEKDGFWSEWDPAGDTLQEGHYKDGKKDGPWIELDENDGEREVHYADGEKVSP